MRAALTCIQVFYLSNARSYTDLSDRTQHLNKATEHYQSYLTPPKAGRHRTAQQSMEMPGRLTQPTAEVRRYGWLPSIRLEIYNRDL